MSAVRTPKTEGESDPRVSNVKRSNKVQTSACVTLFECESRQADTKHTELDARDDNGSGARAQWSRKPKVSIKTMDGSEISLGRREVKEDEHSREVSADPYAETVSSSGAPAVAATIGTQKCIGADAAAEVTSTRTAAAYGTHHVQTRLRNRS